MVAEHGVRAPADQRIERAARILTPQEVSGILERAGADDARLGRSFDAPLMALLFGTGLRLGEALALQWGAEGLDSPGRNLMLAHDRYDVAELNRIAREWREAWGFMSDRRIVVGGAEWAIGDRPVCRRNDYSLGVRNGTRGTVVGLDRFGEHLDLHTDQGETVRIPAEYLTHARHGDALTGHVAQGESVDRTFVLASPERGGDEWAYVAASRQHHDLQVFVTHHEAENVTDALTRTWSRSQAKSLALDLVEPVWREAAMDSMHADLNASTPERLLARDEELRAAREAAREKAGAGVDQDLARVAELRAVLVRAESGAKDARSREARLVKRMDSLSVWKRSERAEARSSLSRARQDTARHVADARAANAELTGLGPMVERALAVESARTAAREIGVDLPAVNGRLDEWAGRGQLVRERPSIARAHDRAGVERELGRDR